jgi:DNA modification methylase
MGSGSTILAAELTKRRAYGIELEPGYVDVAIRRWEEASGQQAILVDTGETFADASAARLPAGAPSERCQD